MKSEKVILLLFLINPTKNAKARISYRVKIHQKKVLNQKKKRKNQRHVQRV